MIPLTFLILPPLFAVAIAGGFAVSSLMMRASAVEDLRILLDCSDTSAVLASGWGEDEFPEFFRARWDRTDRKFYMALRRRLSGRRYGSSRALLSRLIIIQDRAQAAKSDLSKGDGAFRRRTAELLDEWREEDAGFGGFLAGFLEKRHREREGA